MTEPLTEEMLRTKDLGWPEPSKEVLERLVAAGHAQFGFCGLCWQTAGQRALADPEKSQAEHYRDVVAAANEEKEAP